MVKTANKIKELRQKNGVSRETLSEKIGISMSSVESYELGRRTPSLEIWLRLADYFNVSVKELMGVDAVHKQISDLADTFRKSNDRMLSAQLDRISKTKFRDFESLNIAYSIQMVLNLYDRYDDDSDELGDITVILHALNNIINNTVDDDDDYQDTIDTFTKLVNNLKEQNKKASDD